MRGSEREAGMVSAFVAITAIALLLAAGLAFDGGRLLAARRAAMAEAGAAARAGAQAIDVSLVRGSRTATPAPDEAEAAARRYLADRGHAADVWVAAGEVHVRVRIPAPMQILVLAGMRTVTVTGEGRARIVRGVTAGET